MVRWSLRMGPHHSQAARPTDRPANKKKSTAFLLPRSHFFYFLASSSNPAFNIREMALFLLFFSFFLLLEMLIFLFLSFSVVPYWHAFRRFFLFCILGKRIHFRISPQKEHRLCLFPHSRSQKRTRDNLRSGKYKKRPPLISNLWESPISCQEFTAVLSILFSAHFV